MLFEIICGIMCVLLGFAFGCWCMDTYFHSDYYDKKHNNKCLYSYVELEDPSKKTDDRHFYNYDLSKQDFVITGDRHADTIEKSFSKNDFRYSEEYWKYTFEDGKSKKSDHPLSYEEMKPLTDAHGPVKDKGLEVIKV